MQEEEEEEETSQVKTVPADPCKCSPHSTTSPTIWLTFRSLRQMKRWLWPHVSGRSLRLLYYCAPCLDTWVCKFPEESK
jgi:hypothetical protein